MSGAPAYHARTHMPGGTDPIPGGGHGPWIELDLVNGFTGGPLEYRHAPGSPGDDSWELEWRGHIEGPTGTYCGILPAEDRPPSDKYGITEGEDDDTGDGIVVEWYIEASSGNVFITYPVGGSGAASGSLSLISDTTLAVDTANFDITSISGSYKTLLIRLDGRGANSSTSVTVYCRFNNDSGSNYDYEWIYANSVAVNQLEGRAQAQILLGDITAATATSGRSGVINASVHNYAGTTFDKNILAQAGFARGTSAGDIFEENIFGCWRSTAAITRVTLLPSAGNFLTGTRLTIWGVS